ncbi:ferritin [Synechococcus sp. PROS-U-1]|uniref:ferritin n=1 Tax=Synechococcus sp. PROS-U-1 TaxID=1400866 RepID=UPI0016484C73|nr:ferritin [Synechococcus sp. PROS-U-1]QNJ03491.1 ferritin [Synechococcus sp. PROS-U-1]
MLSTSTSRASASIERGPSGRAVAEVIAPDLLNAIQDHLNMERQAHASYFAAAIWFAERELRGFSRFFRDESSSEHEHAAKFAEYIIARGQSVSLKAVEAPLQIWESPADVMASAFQMEVDVTSSLQQLYSMAERVTDTRTTVFLDPMVEMQTQSEHEFAHLLGRVKFADNQAAALLLIDNELDQGNNKPASLQG